MGLLWCQGKMYRTAAVLPLLLTLVQGYPTGAPSCTASPGHGQNTGPVTAVVTKEQTNKWKVVISKPHRGLVINTMTPGSWDSVEPGYQVTSTCVTHVSPEENQEASFVFTSSDDNQPEFSGFLVYDYSSYANILFDFQYGLNF